MTRSGFFALILAALVGASGAVAQTGWYTQQGPGGAFVIEMPAKPTYTAIQAKSGGGTAFTNHSYALDHDGRAYVVQTATYPQDVDVSKPRGNLERTLAGSAKHLTGGKWDKTTWTQVQGGAAVEAIGAMDGKAFRQTFILKGRQVYSVGYLGPADAMRGPEAERYFQSLRLK